jgi:hypothetical protein
MNYRKEAWRRAKEDKNYSKENRYTLFEKYYKIVKEEEIEATTAEIVKKAKAADEAEQAAKKSVKKVTGDKQSKKDKSYNEALKVLKTTPKTELETLREKNEELKAENEKLKVDLKAEKEKHKRTLTSEQIKDSKVTQLKDDNKELLEKTWRLEDEKQALYTALNAELEAANNRYKSLEIDFQELKRVSREENEAATAEIINLQEKVMDLESEILDSDDEEEIELTIATLKSKNGNQAAAITAYEKINTSQVETIRRLEKDLGNRDATIRRLEKEKNDIYSEFELAGN